MDKVSFFALNVFLNSFLTFITVAFLIESLIFLFRIHQGRLAALLRMLPILKLPLDIFLYDFSKWAYIQGVNPLNCEEGTRTLSIMYGGINQVSDWFFLPIASSIHFRVLDTHTFTLADLIGYTIDPYILKFLTFLFFSLTLIFVIRKIIFYHHSFLTLHLLAQNSRPLNKKIRNTSLSSFIYQSNIQILTSPSLIGSPFVTGLFSSIIYIPKHLSKCLTRKEFEAVLAHEIEHIRYKDNITRLILDFIESMFWWVPIRWLRQRIEESQEIGCDCRCEAYGINSLNLATAVYKSAKSSMNMPHIFAYHLTKHIVLNRVNILLNPLPTRFKRMRQTFNCLTAGIIFFMIFLGKFWIF